MWDFYPNGRKGRRIVRTLPGAIKSKEQAEIYVNKQRKDIINFGIGRQHKADDIVWFSQEKVESFFNTAFKEVQSATTESTYREIRSASNNILKFINEKNIPYFALINPTPNLIIEYVSYREGLVSNRTVNKELYAFKKLHEGFVNLGYANPLSFDLSKFYVKEKQKRKYFSEKFYETIFERYPKLFLGEDLSFVETPSQIQGLIPDSLFATKDDGYVVVEIQKELLDRNHTYKILDYRDKIEARLSQNGTHINIRMMVVIIGDECSLERKSFLEKYNIELKVLPVSQIEKKILTLLLKSSG